MDPAGIARRLIAFVAEAEPEEVEVDDFHWNLNIWLHGSIAHERYLPAQTMMEELLEALDKARWKGALSHLPTRDDRYWSLGEAIIFRGFERMIHRGLLIPQRKVPILRGIPDYVALFLITIDNGVDYLERETHGMGWHYHYHNWRKDRSNVILSWDTRWPEPNPQTKPPTQRALFVEPHGEKKNADFQAKPWLWAEKKRKSIYEACAPDLAKWPIGEFKCAADKSQVVHPPGRVLTPHPTAITAAVVSKAAVNTKTIRKLRR